MRVIASCFVVVSLLVGFSLSSLAQNAAVKSVDMSKLDQFRARVLVPPPSEVWFEYSIKVVCGIHKPPALVPGAYLTSVNIHNSELYEHEFDFKVIKLAVSGRFPNAGPVGGYEAFKLNADKVTQLDCENMNKRFNRVLRSSPFEGYVVIFSKYPLDVTGVYTSTDMKMGNSAPATMVVKEANMRRVKLFGSTKKAMIKKQ